MKHQAEGEKSTIGKEMSRQRPKVSTTISSENSEFAIFFQMEYTSNQRTANIRLFHGTFCFRTMENLDVRRKEIGRLGSDDNIPLTLSETTKKGSISLSHSFNPPKTYIYILIMEL